MLLQLLSCCVVVAVSQTWERFDRVACPSLLQQFGGIETSAADVVDFRIVSSACLPMFASLPSLLPSVVAVGRISVMDADVTIGSLGSLKADLIGAVSFDATYVYFNKVSVWSIMSVSVCDCLLCQCR